MDAPSMERDCRDTQPSTSPGRSPAAGSPEVAGQGLSQELSLPEGSPQHRWHRHMVDKKLTRTTDRPAKVKNGNVC
jgi:hypothetical protein